MKKLLRFFNWLTKAWNSFWNFKPQTSKSEIDTSIDVDESKFQIDFVEDIPDLMSNNTIYIIQDGNAPELLSFKCPCNCNADIILNLLEDASPRWSFEIKHRNLIDIYPSIWRKAGCKSHFFVVNGIIKWV